MFSKTTLKSLIIYFKEFSFSKLLFFVINPLVLMYNNYFAMFFTLLLIILVDLRFGIRVYCKENNLQVKLSKPSTWGVITSSGFRQTLNKGKDYFFIVFSVFLLEQYMLKSEVILFNYNLTHISFIVLSAVELWSIGENFRKLRGYNFFELLQKIIIQKDMSATVTKIKKSKKK